MLGVKYHIRFWHGRFRVSDEEKGFKPSEWVRPEGVQELQARESMKFAHGWLGSFSFKTGAATDSNFTKTTILVDIFR